MLKRLIIPIAAIAVLVPLPGCDRCCGDTPSPSTTGSMPGPGPKIILGPDASGDEQWHVNGPMQTDGGSSPLYLRQDFIGLGISKFQCRDQADDKWKDAHHIVVDKVVADENNQTVTWTLHIERSGLDTISYFVRNEATGATGAFISGPVTTGKVPSEVLGYDAPMTDTVTGLTCKEVKIIVNLP